MLLSMTGHGEARSQTSDLAVAVEVRTINSRFFKLSVRSSEGYNGLEPQIEALVRQRVRRGTIQVNVRIERRHSADDFSINTQVLQRYREQLRELYREGQVGGDVALEPLLALPGVVEDRSAARHELEGDWTVVAKTVELALDSLERMRTEEGRAMAADLEGNCRIIGENLARIRLRGPEVANAYRARLEERVRKALEEYGTTLNPADLIREVSLFAERSDIAEEIVRLQSHVDQFITIAAEPDSSGRKLEFLIQEMFREANTIGSKCNDVVIAQMVIEIKTAIDRMREMIQNIE